VFRKHTRRTARAAYAVAMGVALLIGLVGCGGGGSSSSSGAASTATSSPTPTVSIGSKNFTEEYILGQLYKQALQAKGFKVAYHEGVGSSEVIDNALTSGKINFYPEYTGVIALDLAHAKAPKTAAATYRAAKSFEEQRGFTLLKPTPFYDTDSFGTLTSTAQRYGLKTISDVKKIPGTVTFGGFPECATRITCFKGLQTVYGLKNLKFVPLGSVSIYTALDQGKVTAGDVFSTDPQLLSAKYTVLTDTKHLFGFQNVAPVVSKKLASDQRLVDTVDAVSAKLTLAAMKQMNKAVAIDKQQPAAVAKQFLQANGLL
jgi:osmoprotectant transport system substrate-binding protein